MNHENFARDVSSIAIEIEQNHLPHILFQNLKLFPMGSCFLCKKNPSCITIAEWMKIEAIMRPQIESSRNKRQIFFLVFFYGCAVIDGSAAA